MISLVARRHIDLLRVTSAAGRPDQPRLVRLSVGLEGIEDLKADLDSGFRAAKGA